MNNCMTRAGYLLDARKKDEVLIAAGTDRLAARTA